MERGSCGRCWLRPGLPSGRGADAGFAAHARICPGLTANRYYAGPANQIREPSDTGAVGGVPGRWMASGRFDLEPVEALVVTSWPWRGDYQGIQLTDPWFSSLEYGNRQTSLTAEQAQLDSDGTYRFVIAAADPGVPNWLDTVGRTDGIVLMRFDGASGVPFPAEERPYAEKVSPICTLMRIGRRRRECARAASGASAVGATDLLRTLAGESSCGGLRRPRARLDSRASDQGVRPACQKPLRGHVPCH